MRRLNEWKYANGSTTSQATTSNQINYKEKFELILTDILNNFWYTEEAAHEVSEDINAVYLDVIYDDGSEEYYLEIDFNKNSGDWILELECGPCGRNREVIEQANGNDYNSLLDKLLKLRIIKDKKLFENKYKGDFIMKLHEEFKEYENLWEDELKEEFLSSYIRKIAGKKYDLAKESDLRAAMKAANDPQKAKWMRDIIRNGEVGQFSEGTRDMALRVWNDYQDSLKANT